MNIEKINAMHDILIAAGNYEDTVKFAEFYLAGGHCENYPIEEIKPEHFNFVIDTFLKYIIYLTDKKHRTEWNEVFLFYIVLSSKLFLKDNRTFEDFLLQHGMVFEYARFSHNMEDTLGMKIKQGFGEIIKKRLEAAGLIIYARGDYFYVTDVGKLFIAAYEFKFEAFSQYVKNELKHHLVAFKLQCD